ncbi:hypothetical protein SRHO_G00177100 [Serrasalmus rhombeus]
MSAVELSTVVRLTYLALEKSPLEHFLKELLPELCQLNRDKGRCVLPRYSIPVFCIGERWTTCIHIARFNGKDAWEGYYTQSYGHLAPRLSLNRKGQVLGNLLLELDLDQEPAAWLAKQLPFSEG